MSAIEPILGYCTGRYSKDHRMTGDLMATTTIDVRAELPASPAQVYRRLADRSSWSDWSGHSRAELTAPSDEDPAGEGTVWVMYRGKKSVTERVVELEPDRRVTYTLLDGLRLTNYRAGFELAPSGPGTAVHWHSEFTAKPGTGWLYRRALAYFMRRAFTKLSAVAASD